MNRSVFARPSIRVAILASALASLLWIVQALLLAMALGRLAAAHGLAGAAGGAWQDLLPLALGYLLVGAVRASADAWSARQHFAAARAAVTALRRDGAQALAGRSPLDRQRPASGQAASVLAEQAEAVLPWLLRYQPARWRALLVPLAIAACVASLSWLAALILLLAAPMIPLFMAVIGWRARAASEQQLQVQGGINGFLLDRLRGLATLRALGASELTALRLRAVADTLRASTMRVLRIAFLSSTALELFAALGVALVAVLIGFHLLGEINVGTWGRRLSLTQGLFILLLCPAFFEPLRELAALWHDKAAGSAASSALAGLRQHSMPLPGAGLNAFIPAPPLAAGAALAVDLQALRFDHAGAAARDADDAAAENQAAIRAGSLFDGIDLHIGAGEHVALVGASGTGKTTLLALIAGLARADGGAVRIGTERADMADMADMAEANNAAAADHMLALDDTSAAALRARMAWIGQQPHIFAASVGANVALGRPSVSARAIDGAIAFAGLARVHHARAGDRLGEGGAGLSGGELLRMSLARAALGAAAAGLPHIGLILADEPTAHLDRASAAAIGDALLELARGRTLIVATHDRALAARMDRVIDLDAMRERAALARAS